jgi:hypothetical protein
MTIDTKAIATLFALALIASAAQAAEPGLYFGGSVGQATIDAHKSVSNNFDYHFDQDEAAYKLYAGFNFLRFLGVEAGYVDFGNPSERQNLAVIGVVDVEFDLSGWEGFVVGTLPLGPVDLFVKGGGIYANGDTTLAADDGVLQRFDDGGEYPAYGVGAAFEFGKFAVRAEYEGYDVDFDNLYLVSLGVIYHLW